jgi:putative ABC transport system ATP-binding protein
MSKNIIFKEVRKVFSGAENLVALSDISFTIPAGTVAALYGPSGSGKSTILNIASGMDHPTSGDVYLGEDKISQFSSTDLVLYRRKNIGFVFQSFNLFPSLSAVENVELISLVNQVPARLARESALAALKSVGLENRVGHLPSQLSGGQQQRVAVARSIASNPHILFADEPTANLDSQTAILLIELFFELNRIHGTTIVFSTHDPQILSRNLTLIPIKDGRISSKAN